MDTAETIREKIQTLKHIRQFCVDEKRLPTDAEKREADKMIDAINKYEAAGGEFREDDLKFLNTSTVPPIRPELPGGEERLTTEGTPYQLRMAGDKKDYRTMYGRENNEYVWRDKNSNFFQALFSGRFHPELTKRGMSELIPSDGGFLVPTEISAKIHDISLENEIVMPRATVQPMRSNEIKLPAMEIGSHASSLYGGFSASYKPELGSLSEANPKARSMTLMAKKLTGFLRFSNELLQDTPNGEQQLLNICGKGLAWYRDRAFLKGTGAGEPLGILNADCTLVQPQETGQEADTIIYENIIGMMAKMWAGSFGNSVWVCHQTTIPQLMQLSIPVGTGGMHYPILKESNGGFSMLTRPVIFTEKTEVLGDQGDIVLADLSQYVVGLRSEMRIDLSQHVYFTTDEAAARLIERHDGQPLWDEPLTLPDGSNQVSPFVTLAAR